MLVLPVAGCLQAEDVEKGTGVVAAARSEAANIGAEVLESGGNAFDAAIAVQWALNVAEPMMSGIGGGSFWMLYVAEEGRVVVIDGRETWPAQQPLDVFERDAPHPKHWMGYAAGVPGTLAAMEHVRDHYATRDMSSLARPAVALAAQGVEVTPRMAAWIALEQDKLRSWPPSAEVFLVDAVCPPALGACVGGRPPAPGSTLVQTDLAATLAAVAAEPALFYHGAVAQDMVDAVAARDGFLQRADLAAYSVAVREPVWTSFADYDVALMPPPGGGIPVGQILGLASGLELAPTGPWDADTAHRWIEAMRLAYADRDAYLGDPAFVDVPTGLLDEAYLDARRGSIQDGVAQNPGPGTPGEGDEGSRSMRSEPTGDHAGESDAAGVYFDGGHTTHFVVVDGWGNVASVTSTIESVFGNGMVVPGRGFLLNNELTDFSASGPNAPAAGKRPLSSMSPTIAFRDAEPVFVAGSPGGRTIVATVAQVLVNHLAHGLPVEDAVERGRLYPASFPEVRWDRDLAPDVEAELRVRGHQPDVTGRLPGPLPFGLGYVHAAERIGTTWIGHSDSRGEDGAAVS